MTDPKKKMLAPRNKKSWERIAGNFLTKTLQLDLVSVSLYVLAI